MHEPENKKGPPPTKTATKIGAIATIAALVSNVLLMKYGWGQSILITFLISLFAAGLLFIDVSYYSSVGKFSRRLISFRRAEILLISIVIIIPIFLSYLFWEIREVLPSRVAEYVVLPIENRESVVIDLSDNVREIRFEDVLTVIIERSSVLVQSTYTDNISCRSIIDSPDDGLGYDFSYNGMGYYLWFLITPREGVNYLEVGLYEQNTNIQYYWIDTFSAICN